MRILFDQGTPFPLKQHFPEHQVQTAFELGWARLSNGDLLAAAEVSVAEGRRCADCSGGGE